MSKITAGPIEAARAAWVRIGRQKPDGNLDIFRKADAEMRLISSAPDLLAALNAIVNHPAHEDPLSGRKVIAARAAISKATGAQS